MKNILNHLLLFIAIFTTISANATTYYYCNNNPTKYNELASWKTNLNCTGTSPTTFTNSSDLFIINRFVNINKAWSINAQIIINSTCNISGNGQISSNSVSLGANSTLTINNSNIPTLVSANITSTIIINHTSNYTLPAIVYGAVLLYGDNTTITLNGNTTIDYLLMDSCKLELNNYKLTISNDYETVRQSIFIGSNNSELNFQTNNILTSNITFSQNSNSDKTIKSLTLNGTTVTIDSSLFITHLLDLTANSTSNLITNDNVFLLADVNYTSQVANMTNCTITGKIHYQIYIPASNGRYWYNITAPLDDVNVLQWQTGASTNNGIYVTGTFAGASNPGNGIRQSGISCYSWNSITQTWSNFPKVNNLEYIDNSTGYRFFIRNGNATLAPTTPAKTINNFGYVKSGTISFTLNYDNIKGGWNLLGNPYPADITADLTNSAWSFSGLANSTIWIWDAEAGVYVACNGGVGDCIIPAGQSFWVETNTLGANIQVNETAKTLTSQTIYKKASNDDYLNIKLVNPNNIENNYYLRLNTDYNNDIDNYDALKKWESFMNTIYVSISGIDSLNNYYNIDSRKEIKNTDTIKIHLITSQGINNLSFKRNDFSYTGNIYLHDSYLNTKTLIDNDMVYPFDVTSNISSIQNRFYLTFYKEDIITNTNQSNIETFIIYPNPNNDYFKINSQSKIDKIEITNVSGQIILTKSFNSSNYIITHSLNNGLYNAKIYSNNNIYFIKIIVCK